MGGRLDVVEWLVGEHKCPVDIEDEVSGWGRGGVISHHITSHYAGLVDTAAYRGKFAMTYVTVLTSCCSYMSISSARLGITFPGIPPAPHPPITTTPLPPPQT